MDNFEIDKLFSSIKGGLIVSCQALETEPLYSSYIMGRMAVAAQEGGAVCIRANTPKDIEKIKKNVALPVIGLYKVEYPDSEVYITPTMSELDALMAVSPEIIAVDATKRLRPNGQTLESFFNEIKKKYPNQILMADTSCFEEGEYAQKLGFDIVGTTLAGYTPYTKGTSLPAFELMEEYVQRLSVPIIAEGGIWDTEQLKKARETGVFAYVIGGAITRPREITRHFIEALK